MSYDWNGTPSLAEDELIIEREKPVERSVQGLLESVGVSLLSDWDVLAFVYRHGVSLTSIAQIASLIGYENSIVAGALDRLEREQLIERSRPSQEVCLYRIFSSMDAERQYCLRQLFGQPKGLAGRLILAKRQARVWLESGREEESPESRR
jgi:MarR family